MDQNLKKLLIESLKDQQDIFGDDLLQNLTRTIKASSASKPKLTPSEENNIVAVKKEIISEGFNNSKSLDELYDNIHTCLKCQLGETRTKFVFGVGNPNAEVLLVGEAPGAEEDKQGEPFVGRAGKLLTDIMKAINFTREEIYIANILKCRPPNNRDPLTSEMQVCRPYLDKQIELIAPKAILCLGRIAGNSLLNQNTTLGKLREDVHDLNGIKTMVTFHPAALLRNPNWKRDCWEDVKKFRALYDELKGK